MELLHKKMQLRNRSYYDNNWYYCFTDEYKKYGQTLFKFCFDNIKTAEELENEINSTCRWHNKYYIFPRLFDDKIKKIIMLQNKIKED
jgi:hypothetical protein